MYTCRQITKYINFFYVTLLLYAALLSLIRSKKNYEAFNGFDRFGMCKTTRIFKTKV
jgi:hypothetical protein